MTELPDRRLRGAASLLEQISRLIQATCWDTGMHPAQWSALRYFGTADREARTTNGLSRFQGTNPGTASRTISALARKGLVTSVVDPDDRRVRTVTLTEDGSRMLETDPLLEVARALEASGRVDPAALGAALEGVYRALLEARLPEAPGRAGT